jgi:hypothetical protein
MKCKHCGQLITDGETTVIENNHRYHAACFLRIYEREQAVKAD